MYFFYLAKNGITKDKKYANNMSAKHSWEISALSWSY